MAKRKSKFKRRNTKSLDIDITSLLDILVILLVFLLKSYNPSDLTLDVPKGLTLPYSDAKTLGSKSVIIQVNSENRIWINEKELNKISENDSEILSELHTELKAINKEMETEIQNIAGRGPASDIEKESFENKKFNLKKINIVLDENIPYKVMRKVMHTAASAGFPEFKFIVQANHE